MPRKTLVQCVCQHCQQPFDCLDYRHNRPPKYCSRNCRDLARSTRVALTCVQCGQSFERKAYMADWSQERGPFCGFDCYAAWQSEHCSGEANPNYRADRHAVLQCDWCGKDFHRPKWVRNGRLTFCSRPCFHEFAREYWRHQKPVSYGKSWPRVRVRVLERDGHQCQECGAFEPLVVHHIVEYRTFENAQDAHELDNLVTLCRACHQLQHNQSSASGH